MARLVVNFAHHSTAPPEGLESAPITPGADKSIDFTVCQRLASVIECTPFTTDELRAVIDTWLAHSERTSNAFAAVVGGSRREIINGALSQVEAVTTQAELSLDEFLHFRSGTRQLKERH